jgi:hypothetical protein
MLIIHMTRIVHILRFHYQRLLFLRIIRSSSSNSKKGGNQVSSHRNFTFNLVILPILCMTMVKDRDLMEIHL